jgi:hypothetical protein
MSQTLLCVSLTTETADETLAALHAPGRDLDLTQGGLYRGHTAGSLPGATLKWGLC